jgi:hypothetical protein
MDMRESFSRLKKKLKHPLTRSKRKPDKTGAGADGEKVDAGGSLPQLEPPVAAGGGRDQEGSGANTIGGQLFSMDRLSTQSDGEENAERVRPSQSTPSLVPNVEPDSM